ncbi:hypothetical protein [Kineosporia sp. NBRC 101731]|uniref:hypothetical protein n=1 Tax=Kineosporia sp. NBRC 101731 TaxID=3032199 RepID=UPI0024A4242C|nr:hypothetical protein [Kineosporia sp. NBRC 101731]GLY29402.1 hypothetical protein Kisp02_27670 [Kineosporia sp. NBRC 101731]
MSPTADPNPCRLPAARTISALAGLGGLLHLATLTAHDATAWVFGAMALICLGCALHLMRARSRSALMMASGMAALMIVAHLGYLLAVTPAFTGAPTAHGHGAVALVAAPTLIPHTSHVSPGMLLPLLPELAVLALTGPVLRRSRPMQQLRP